MRLQPIDKNMRSFALAGIVSAFVGLCFIVTLTTNTVANAKPISDDGCPGDCQKSLAEAKAATAQYHIVQNAFSDGFFSTGTCVAVPGLGAMGIHFINPARMFDGQVDESQPETLLYLSDGAGGYKLLGLEYYMPVIVGGMPWFGPGPPPVPHNPAPELFGRTFDGPMPGFGPGQPWHYSLHVWAWKHNPNGMFTPFNPKLSCQ